MEAMAINEVLCHIDVREPSDYSISDVFLVHDRWGWFDKIDIGQTRWLSKEPTGRKSSLP